MNYVLLLVAHALAWRVFSSFLSILGRRENILDWGSAAGLGVVSGALHIIVNFLKGVF